MESMKSELAWAAGFFDGEGTSYVARHGRNRQHRRICITVSQKDRRPMDRFVAAVGGHVRENRLYVWHESSARAIEAMEKLWPYLSEPKREQWLQCLREE